MTTLHAIPTTLAQCQELDAADPLRHLAQQFDLPQGVIYLDGNSLGALPKATAARVAQTVTQEWGQGLITSWNGAGWFTLPQRVGDKIAPLIGADAGQVVAADTTSANLYKVLSTALQLAQRASTDKRTIVSERSNFPTDLYIAQALCKSHGFTLRLVDAQDIEAALQPDVAVLMLTHVNYRTGAMHDMAQLCQSARAQGILTVWDLAHSAGAVPVHLLECEADFAVGCGYKYLNGGPGAPAFVWLHPRHARHTEQGIWQPLTGWWGHAAPFAFTTDYQPAAGITHYQCGTQPILNLAALDCGLDTLLAAQALGGMAALRRKSLALTDAFMHWVSTRVQGHGLGIATPLQAHARGSQVSLTRETGAYAIVQALIARGVIGDFRAGDGAQEPDILRFGITPLYVGHADVWHAVEHLRQVMDSGEWQHPRFARQHTVT